MNGTIGSTRPLTSASEAPAQMINHQFLNISYSVTVYGTDDETF